MTHLTASVVDDLPCHSLGAKQLPRLAVATIAGPRETPALRAHTKILDMVCSFNIENRHMILLNAVGWDTTSLGVKLQSRAALDRRRAESVVHTPPRYAAAQHGLRGTA